jgi:hypothetical protein
MGPQFSMCTRSGNLIQFMALLAQAQSWCRDASVRTGSSRCSRDTHAHDDVRLSWGPLDLVDPSDTRAKGERTSTAGRDVAAALGSGSGAQVL